MGCGEFDCQLVHPVGRQIRLPSKVKYSLAYESDENVRPSEIYGKSRHCCWQSCEVMHPFYIELALRDHGMQSAYSNLPVLLVIF